MGYTYMINDKIAILFNDNSEKKRRFQIKNPLSGEGEGMTLHISMTSSILSWNKASDSGNIFEIFAAGEMQYTFFIGIYEHDRCWKVYGPFSIKAVDNIDTIIFEEHISTHFYEYCGISSQPVSVDNEGKVICLVNGPAPRSAARAAAVEGCLRMSTHRSVPRTTAALGAKRQSVSTVCISCTPNASQWRISAAAFWGWNVFSASTVI